MNEHKHAMKCHSGQYCNFYCKINAFEGLQNLPVEGMQESMRNKTLIVKRHITFSSNIEYSSIFADKMNIKFRRNTVNTFIFFKGCRPLVK